MLVARKRSEVAVSAEWVRELGQLGLLVNDDKDAGNVG